MIKRLQSLPLGQRRFVFFLIFFGVLILLVAITLLLVSGALNTGRRTAVALDPAVTVREFAALPDDDAYPAAVAASAAWVYSGSYATGAVWRISADGEAEEIGGSRDAIGAVSGLAVAADETLFVVDQKDTDPRTGGGSVWRVETDGTITLFADLASEGGFVTPDDITLDAEGRVYVTDRGRNQIWRFEADGSGAVAWWTAPDPPEGEARGALTGLAYDASRNAIVATDPDRNVIYQIGVADASGSVLYAHDPASTTPPGFDGATVTPDGTLYVAALGQNGIARVEDGTITYVAGLFRGASDVDYGAGNRLYVANFDQSSLVVPLVAPQLPFAIDVIMLGDEAEEAG